MRIEEIVGFATAFLGVVAAMMLLNARLSERAQTIRRRAYNLIGLYVGLLPVFSRVYQWDGKLLVAACAAFLPLLIFLVDKEGEIVGKAGAWIQDGFGAAVLLVSAGYLTYLSMSALL